MKIFIDTANLEEIKWANELGILDGVTTNPTLLAREGKDPIQQLKKICAAVKGPITAEVLSPNVEGMVKEARRYAKLAPNIVIKVPMGEEGLKAVKALSKEGIKTNMTLVFSVNQGLLAAKAGATYVSPFIGRMDDVGREGMQVARELVQVFKNYGFKSQVIVASIRHPLHVIEAVKTGAPIATIPFNVIKKMLGHPLTDVGIKRFQEDWEKLLKIKST
jgi:transaldolase